GWRRPVLAEAEKRQGFRAGLARGRGLGGAGERYLMVERLVAQLVEVLQPLPVLLLRLLAFLLGNHLLQPLAQLGPAAFRRKVRLVLEHVQGPAESIARFRQLFRSLGSLGRQVLQRLASLVFFLTGERRLPVALLALLFAFLGSLGLF